MFGDWNFWNLLEANEREQAEKCCHRLDKGYRQGKLEVWIFTIFDFTAESKSFPIFELNISQSFSLEKLSSNSVKLLMSLQKAPNEVIQSEFRLAESFLNDSWVVLQNYLIVSRGRMADSYWVPKIRNDFDSALLFELVC